MTVAPWFFVSNVFGTLGALAIAIAALLVRRRQNEAVYQAWISAGALLILACFFLQALPFVARGQCLSVAQWVIAIIFGIGAVFIILWRVYRQPKKNPSKRARKPK
jgi:hypothetical protein